jgi:hypothetical protein
VWQQGREGEEGDRAVSDGGADGAERPPAALLAERQRGPGEADQQCGKGRRRAGDHRERGGGGDGGGERQPGHRRRALAPAGVEEERRDAGERERAGPGAEHVEAVSGFEQQRVGDEQRGEDVEGGAAAVAAPAGAVRRRQPGEGVGEADGDPQRRRQLAAVGGGAQQEAARQHQQQASDVGELGRDGGGVRRGVGHRFHRSRQFHHRAGGRQVRGDAGGWRLAAGRRRATRRLEARDADRQPAHLALQPSHLPAQ